MAGLLLLSLNSHSHKKMFVTVTSSTVSTKTYEILIYFLRATSSCAHILVGGAYNLSLRLLRLYACVIIVRCYDTRNPVTVWEEILLY